MKILHPLGFPDAPDHGVAKAARGSRFADAQVSRSGPLAVASSSGRGRVTGVHRSRSCRVPVAVAPSLSGEPPATRVFLSASSVSL